MFFNLNDIEERKKCVSWIESNENKGRKNESFQRSEIYKDRIDQFVLDELRTQYDETSVKEIPRSRGVNICKRAVNKTSIVYLESPKRTVSGVTKEQVERIDSVYKDGCFDTTHARLNKYYKLHNQMLVQMKPEQGKLTLKLFQPHHYDAIYLDEAPEKAVGYVFSSYDKSTLFQDQNSAPESATGNTSQMEGETDNYLQRREIEERSKNERKRFSAYYWTPDKKVLNFIFNGNGVILSETLELDFMPFIEVSEEKDFEYWVRNGSPFADFTIEFNVRLSEASQVVKLQGFSQAFIKGPKSMLMQNIKIGPNHILKLPVDKEEGVETEFGFANTNADIAGTIEFLKSYLFLFLSSQSLDQSSVTTSENSEKYNSGFERLIAMIDRMITNKDDFTTFYKYELELFSLASKWLTVTSTNDTLLPEYRGALPANAKMTLEYNKPESVKTETEELDVLQKKIDMGISSPIAAIMYFEKVDRTEAVKRYAEYQEDNMMGFEDNKEEVDPITGKPIEKKTKKDDSADENNPKKE